MRSEKTKTLISVATIVGGLVIAFFLTGFIDRNRPGLPEGYEDEDLSLQGAKLKGFSFGMEGLIADWYWMRSLQYLGDKLVKTPGEQIDLNDLRRLNPRLLYPFLDTATDLDPQFVAAYSYGAVVLPAIDPQKAIDLTSKGIANNPEEWRLYHYLGYIYWRLEQYDKAADIYEKGSHIAGAPPFMQMMTAQLRTQGGSRDTAREMYRQMVEGAHDDQVKESAALQLLRLDALDETEAINTVLSASQSPNGRCPNSFSEIQSRLRGARPATGRPLNFDKTGAPLDPLGIPYLLVNTNGLCRADIDFEHSKIPRQ
jgi:tetratricopeptide (TPR) repeat protein